MAIAQKPPAERKVDPLVNMVKESKDFNQMKNDPEMMNEAVRKWDEAHGEKQTDIILKTVGLVRPGAQPQEDEVQEEAEFTPVDDINDGGVQVGDADNEPDTDLNGNVVESD